ncbi:hypothetical protein ES703_106261 [subsurface metagenome]
MVMALLGGFSWHLLAGLMGSGTSSVTITVTATPVGGGPIFCPDPNVTITDQGVTDDPASDPRYDPTNMPSCATWEDAKGFYLEATGPDGIYEFFVTFDTPVEPGFRLYKLPAWIEVAYTIVGPNTIRVELEITGGAVDPPFVLCKCVAEPPPPPLAVGGEVYPINKASVLAPWLSLILILAIGGGILALRRSRAH